MCRPFTNNYTFGYNIEYVIEKQRKYSPQAKGDSASIVNIRNYQVVLDSYLTIQSIMTHISNCMSPIYINELHPVYTHIVHSCVSATTTIPYIKAINGKQRMCIPGWAWEHSLARDRSLFWHRLWIDNDRPEDGWVATLMRSIRSRYHYLIRNLKCSRATPY